MNNAALRIAAMGTVLTLASTPAMSQPADAELVDQTVVETAKERDTLEPEVARRHTRMALEALAIQSIGTAWYWRNTGDGWGASNVVDWQLGFKGSALTSKLGFDRDGWRFDGNSFALNALCHPGFGALTYWAARKNNYGVAESFAISTLMSGTWELFTEWAEYGSINDALSTSTTGVPLGEAAYQLTHNWRRARYAVSLGTGVQAGDAIMSAGGRVELDTVPLEGAGVVVGGRRINVGADLSLDGAGGVRGVEAGTKSSLVGYYSARENHRVFTGASGEFYYRDNKDRDSRDSDLLATIGAGPTIDSQHRLGDTTIAIGADIYADFGMVKAQAYDRWRAVNPTAIVRNSMQDKARPYYYAAGVTANPRINVTHKGVAIGGKVVASLFKSMNGADRDQEMLTADPSIKDRDTSAQAWLGYSRDSISVALDGRLHRRTGTMDNSRSEARDRTTMLTLSYLR
jgi:hypothetical protein